MIGTICSVFSGESWESCLENTEDQIRNKYHEARKQEARRNLTAINNLIAAKNTEAYERITNDLHLKGYPADPETDGDMGKGDILRLKAFFGDSARVEQ